MVDDITDSFSNVISSFIEFIPGLVAALVLLLVGRFVAGFVSGLFKKLLDAIKFDRWVDKSGLGAYVERAGYADSGALLAKIVGWIIMLIFVQLAVSSLGIDSIEELVNEFVSWIPNVIIAIILIVITGVAANFAKDVLSPSVANVNAGDLILKIVSVAIWVTGGMMAINQLGFGEEIVQQLWNAITTGLVAIIVIKFGIGGIWAARDRFWPKVYDAVEDATPDNIV